MQVAVRDNNIVLLREWRRTRRVEEQNSKKGPAPSLVMDEWQKRKRDGRRERERDARERKQTRKRSHCNTVRVCIPKTQGVHTRIHWVFVDTRTVFLNYWKT